MVEPVRELELDLRIVTMKFTKLFGLSLTHPYYSDTFVPISPSSRPPHRLAAGQLPLRAQGGPGLGPRVQ